MCNPAMARSALPLAALLLLAACASPSPHRASTGTATPRCPAAHTMTCEADRIGRIFHGTFRKNYEKCACVPDTGRTIDSPVIPGIRQ